MRQFARINPLVRWAAQPPVRYKSSRASRKWDFVPASKQLPARQADSKVVARTTDAPVASLDDARRVLKETFGHDAFRPEQETVVSKILAGRNVVLQWPEHSGRSTAYLTAGLAETQNRHGLIIVVSHSRTFLTHSEHVLGSSGVFTGKIDEQLSDLARYEERMTTLAAVRSGALRVLYLHTGLLEDHDIATAINETQGGLHLLVIDETQVQSTGDYDFGGGLMKKMNDFMAKVQPRTTAILAHNHVFHDHTDKYLDIGEVFTSHMPWQPQLNLRIQVLADGPRPSYSGVLNILKGNPVQTLIFTQKDKRQHDFQGYLRRCGLHAKPLVSRTGDFDLKNLDDFCKSNLPILIATPSSSVIVDKPDLHQIILSTIPNKMEKLDLLCRLAGRDGQMSKCVMVADAGQFFREDNRARATQCSFAAIKAVVHEIFHLRKERLPAGLHSLIVDHPMILGLDLNDADLSFVLSLLESSLGYIKLLMREYASCQFQVLPGHEVFLQNDRTPTGIAIARHSRQNLETGLFDLDIRRAARAEGLPHFVQLTAKVDSLHSLGHIKVHPRNSLLVFRLNKIVERGPETEAVAKWLHQQLLARDETKAQGRRQVHDILFGNSCISAAIANHFGSQLPGGAVRCGRCSFCLDGKPAKAPSFTPKEVMLHDINQVLDEIPNRDNPRLLTRIVMGVHTPRIRRYRHHLSPVFRSMDECKFEDVLQVFAGICGVPPEEA